MQNTSDPDSFLIHHAHRLQASYAALFGKPLIEGLASQDMLIDALFNAPFVLLSHNTAPDPVFNYANAKALALFEYPWDELKHTPSRLSAEIVNQTERERLLRQVREFGYIDDYHGIRISKSGRRFSIAQARVWNLFDEHNHYQGQAACFNTWIYLPE